MKRIAVFHVEHRDKTSEVITMPVDCGLAVLGPGGIPRHETLRTLHQAILDENPEREKIHFLIFVDQHTEHGEIELHRPEAR